MQKHFLKFRRVFTNFACSPLILISNNSELAAKYLPKEVDQSIRKYEINSIQNSSFQGVDITREKFFIAENKKDTNQESVLISEIIIEGWENHPEGKELELKHTKL